jgi:hypothetical protein
MKITKKSCFQKYYNNFENTTNNLKKFNNKTLYIDNNR